ncbi:Hypothetical Protein FCC1311_035592 [Hondaea fermentalgiana]|uniref:SYO1-like TPR repeats domain-containing protein n=1 Tax=Hondaea fermentalgiana TaxID=2315210 RepID=A0A2R5G8G1_9STRA|nr:Hypothetical Protein FCC1311_035592 [Hondaea fermentalgiana]|eukprot:GBG27337.1 Hypothetical Protein FCC1311_035592 [Hondaea fermentalgiana]
MRRPAPSIDAHDKLRPDGQRRTLVQSQGAPKEEKQPQQQQQQQQQQQSGAEARHAARKDRTRRDALALIRALQSGETQDRIQGLLALASTFEAGPEKAQEQSEVFEVLFTAGALPVFVARLSDGDASVRHLASGIMCNMCSAGGAEVASRLIHVGIHTAALELAKRGIPTESKELATQAMQTRVRALDLLAELCASSPAALRALEDLDGSAFLAVAGILETQHAENLELASETVEVVARLLNVALESNPALARAAVQSEAACKTLTTFCARAPLPQVENVALRLAHARAVLHAVSALMSMAGATPETAQKLAPQEVFARMLSIVNEILNADDVDTETASLALEVVTSACAVSVDATDGNDGPSAHERALRRACADMVGQNQIAQRCAHIVRSSEEALDSSIAQELAPRACGLLDNLVQNASLARVAALDPQGMGTAGIQVLSAMLIAADQGGEDAMTSLEDFADMMTAFLWSLARRVAASREEMGPKDTPLSWKLSNEQLGVLVAALQQELPPNARANTVGVLGVLGMDFTAWDTDAMTRIGTAVLGAVTDVSLLVVTQAMDSAIDIFAADELHELFVRLSGLSVLKTALPRLRACLNDSAARIDPQVVALVLSNGEDFVQYKQDFIRQH